ncbi:outer membrane beta-barrel protein [Pedobacter sp. KR3-3]|uniref:Outer membrane beta-barrel protein n=1 Tax=Pedobacter albus TaxID=3113905 RepID=A0ABU7IBH1_9SPHI|nr:outer membrane beta-barrel protein [Pedobacter sp. KR3-3]MEE1946816.1 outer membrane beta-barrel protein [Pedobacter sp. KR3-3]
MKRIKILPLRPSTTNCFVILILLSFFGLAAKAQEKPKLQGLLKDSASHEPLSFVTVSLLKTDSTKAVVASVLSDSTGRFVLHADSGTYLLSFNLFGYHKWVKPIKVSQPNAGDLTVYVLKPMSNQLKQVVITGQKQLISQDKDKLVYNVEQDVAARGESLTEIFRKIPMLSVDGEGNVQLNGQTNYKVLLNGRETAMFVANTKDALRGFPGVVVSKIEVITNPSAKYDAEGVGGLINIITKKGIMGYNGFLSAYYSNLNYQTSTNLSVRSGKFAITGTYFLSGNHNNKAGITSETLPLQPSAYQRRFLEGERITNRFSNDGNLEMSYNIDTLQTIVAYANVGGGNNKSRFTQNITTDFANMASQHDLFTQNVRNSIPTFGLGSDFIKKFKGNANRELSFRFNGQFSKNDGLNTSLMAMANGNLFRQNDSYSKNREYTLQSDYIEPLTQSTRLETGAKFIFRDANANYLSLSKTQESDPFEPDYSNSNNFAYKQQVYSGYGSLSFSLNKLNFRTGLRLEHTTVDGDFLSSHTNVKQNYTSLIPDFSMNTKLSDKYTLVFGYTKRLQRPYINTLNPFVNNNDPLNISFGNPNLSAQTIHSLALQNRLLMGPIFMSLILNASYTGNMIVQYTTFNETNGISTTQYGNLGKNREASATFTFAANLQKLRSGFGGTVRYNKIENTAMPTQHEQGFSGQVYGFFSYSFYKSLFLSGNGGVGKPAYTLINTVNAFPYYQVNIGAELFDKKLTASVNFNRFFNKWFTAKSYTEDANFRTLSTTTTPYRVIYFGFTYNFGKLKENLSKKKGVNNDDLINN